MKRLMTMLAAAGTALGLYAAPYGNGSTFEVGDGATVGATTIAALNALTETTGGYWATNGVPDTLSQLEIKAYGTGEAIWGENRPAQFYDATQGEDLKLQDQYLAVKTTFGNPLSRKVLANGQPQAVGAGFYFDSLVKLTPTDEAPDTTSYTGAKIIIWAQEMKDANNEDVITGTNLFVRANAGANGAVTANYDCGSLEAFNLDAWHRLTIKALPDIDGNGSTGFIVFIDQSARSHASTEDITGLTLSGPAADRNNKHQLFVSMNEENDGAITEVAFDGTGAVDDISFTDVVPFDNAKDAEFYTVTWDRTIDSVNGVTGGTTNVLVTGDQDTFTYVAASGYISGSANITGVANQTYEISAQKIAGTVYKREGESWVLVSGGEVATISEALALMANTSDEYKLELGDNATDIVINKPDYTITLDLAGKAVTTLTDAAIFVEAGNVTIIDSVGGATVTAFYDGANWGYAVGGFGDITIEDGTYIGWVGATSLLGGRYAKSVYSEASDLEAMIVEAGLEVVDDTDTDYWKIQELHGPIEIPVPEAYVGILYDGTLKTGVVEGVGYTLTGNTATDVGSYTATATLVSGYAWTGGSMEPTNIVWGIGAPVFQITYDLGGGTAGAGAPGTYAYNAEQQTVTLVAPTCEGSNFVSWVISSPVTQGLGVEGQTLTIPAGHMGDIALAATWSADSTTYVAGELVNCTDAAAAADLASQINANKETYIKVPSGIDNTGGAYTGLFQATAEGTIVSIRFTDDAATSQSNIVNTAATSIPISAIAAGVVGSQLVFVGTPGVYYSVSRATAIDGTWTEGARQMAPASGTVTFLVGKDSEASAEFFRVNAYEDDGRLY